MALWNVLSPQSDNPSSFSGAVDIIVVKHETDNTHRSTPFHVRFGSYTAPRPFNVNVEVAVNDKRVDNVCMTLNKYGIAHFDGPQQPPSTQHNEEEEKQQEEEVAVTDDGSQQEQKQVTITVDKANEPASNSGDTHSSKPKSRVRKRDKLRAFVQSSWSYWSGSEAEDDDEDDEASTSASRKKKQRKYKSADTDTDAVASPSSSWTGYFKDVFRTAHDYAASYMQNSLESQWMIEQEVINVNNIPNEQQMQQLIPHLQSGKNIISFTIRTPSKTQKLRNALYTSSNSHDKMLTAKPSTADDNEQNSDNDVVTGDAQVATLTGDDVVLKERTISANIYLWLKSDKVVISDVDGTITKGDVGGNILPTIGFDWGQNGVSPFMNRLNSYGYRILYLTARGISQSERTRNYLFQELNLPNGAVICSPSTISAALYREVIQKRPQDFKIPTLNRVVNAFGGVENNPFFAGFGNRMTDALSYKYLGLDKTKVFIIGVKPEKQPKQNAEQDDDALSSEDVATFIKDYNDVLENVDTLFPKNV